MKTLDTEIFAAGKWNGLPFTAKELQGMADTFAELGDNMRVALKMGHNKEQKMTDGQPALGWVEKVWVQGEKLMARLTDLPEVVYDAIVKKLYRNVSIELDVDVNYKEKNYPYVLTGVALLGADIPAVNTLADLKHYMSRGAAFSVGRSVVFSAIAGNKQGEVDMDEIKELTNKVATLTAQLATFTAENAKVLAEKVALEAKVAKFEVDAKAANDAAKVVRLTAKRKDINDIFEAGVKAGTLLPAQRENFSKILKLEDDVAVDAIDMAQVKALVPGSGKAIAFGKREGMQGDGDNNESGNLPPDQQIAKEIATLRAATPTMSFAAAQQVVFSRNPELAKEYVAMNGRSTS